MVRLFLGDAASATREFENITATGNATAAQWSDYAALLHASAAADDALQLATALAATEHALDLDPSYPAALFNRALILDGLSLRVAAVAAYDKYLHFDQVSPWAEETRSRRDRIDVLHTRASLWQERLPALQRAATAGDALFINDIVLTFPEESRRWGETIFLGEWADAVVSNNTARAQNRLSLCRLIGQSLETQRGESLLADTVRGIDAMSDTLASAEAVAAYRDGRLSYSQGDARGALRAFKSATQTFQTRLQPMELVARYYAASASLDIGLTLEALTQADHVERRAPSRYRALRAQLTWLYASYLERGGEHKYAVKSLQQVVDTFTALGEEQNATNTRNATADALRNAGAISEAWPLRHASLVSASARAQNTQVARTVYSMAIDAIADGRWDVAYALLNVVTTMSEAPRDAIAWCIAAAKRSGLHRTAAVHLAQARTTRGFDPQVVDALIADDQTDAIRLLTASLKIAELTGTMSGREELLLERSHLLRAKGQRALATRDADEAVALMNKRVYVLPTAAPRENSAEANAQLAESYGLRGDALRAIQASERMLLQQVEVPFAVPAKPP